MLDPCGKHNCVLLLVSVDGPDFFIVKNKDLKVSFISPLHVNCQVMNFKIRALELKNKSLQAGVCKAVVHLYTDIIFNDAVIFLKFILKIHN